ncbi:MAG: cell division protein FtsL [Rhodospirillales bacterium]
MMKRAGFTAFAVAFALGCGFFVVAYEVKSLEEDLDGLNRKIADEQEAIHVLRAEWAYLNDPSRLEALAERHLGLAPLDPARIVSFESLPERRVEEPEAEPVAGDGNDGPAQSLPSALKVDAGWHPTAPGSGDRQP